MYGGLTEYGRIIGMHGVIVHVVNTVLNPDRRISGPNQGGASDDGYSVEG